jgi:hypothetical protein
VFLDRHYSRDPPPAGPDVTVTSLAEAAEWILQRASR